MIKLSYQNNLGEQLKKARKESGLNQCQVAGRANISVPTVRMLERGRGNIDSWNKVLSVLDISLAGRNLPKGDAIGKQIALLRRRRGLSQRALANMIQTTQPTMVALERRNEGRLHILDSALTVLGAGAYLKAIHDDTSFYSHAGNSSTSMTWRTPKWLLEKLYGVFGEFDLDPCSPTKNRSTAPVKAKMHYTVDDDGLSLSWFGNVFVNPPYGRTIQDWIAKSRMEVESGNARSVAALIPARTDTRWWHRNIVKKATVLCLRGRLSFDDCGQSAPFPSAIVAWGASPEIVDKLRQEFPDAWLV